MASDVVMPRLSDSMEEGTVLKWLIEEGGEVKRGEALVEIETDKANMTYDADTDGVLVEIVAQEGDTLPIGEVIARIGEAGEAKQGGKQAEAEPEEAEEPEAEAEPEEAEAEEAEAQPAETEEAPAVASAEAGGGETEAGAGTATRTRPAEGNGAGDGGRVKASPVARRMARELGVELARLEGTGPGGRIVKADVQAAADNGGAQAEAEAPPAEAPAEKREEREPAAAPAPERGEAGPKGQAEIQELTRLQQTVSRRMAESKATAPDFSISLTVDMTKAVELRARLKEVADPAPSFNDMVVKAAATALREHPRVNGAYRDGKFELYEKVNIGVAVAAMDALVVPDRVRRRPEVPGADLQGRARGDREGARQDRDAARAVGRHVHRLEPRHVRDRALHGDHQPAAGIDPHRRCARQAPGRGRERADRGSRPDDAQPGLRPPHPLRRGRRQVPRAREGTARAAAVARAVIHGG